jgi:predicted NACHT family NTPase
MQQRNEDGTNYQIQTGENNINYYGGGYPPYPPEIVSSGVELDDIVQQTREAIRASLKAQCGTMRVLDMPNPIDLTGENGIYTNVHILEGTTHATEDARAIGEDDGSEFGRRGQREQGKKVVQKHPKLMVRGKPGAGKTTFLKYLAMECITGGFAEDKVPFFVILKDFAEEAQHSPSLVEYLANKVAMAIGESSMLGGITPAEIVKRLLLNGRVLILLDGLDEVVLKKDCDRIIREIKDSANYFDKSFFVITCRTAAQEYVFERFTEVEVAEFDDQQINSFVTNWFGSIEFSMQMFIANIVGLYRRAESLQNSLIPARSA